MYNIDFDKLVNNLLPSLLRKLKQKAWLVCLITPLKTLYVSFLNLRTDKLLEAFVTGQVASLQFLLNKLVYGDGNSTNVFISDNTLYNRIFIFNRAESSNPVYIFNRSENANPVYVFNRSESRGVDFFVHVPEPVSAENLNKLRSLINKYKQQGNSYSILEYLPSKSE